MNQDSFEDKMKRLDWLTEQANMARISNPKSGRCQVTENIAVMDREYFNSLNDYSQSMPTGVFIGKRWKRNINVGRPEDEKWYMGEFEDNGTMTSANVKWRRIEITNARTQF